MKKLNLIQVVLGIVLILLTYFTAQLMFYIKLGDIIAITVAATAFYYLLIAAIRDQLVLDYNEKKKKSFCVINLANLDREILELLNNLPHGQYLEYDSKNGIDKLSFLIQLKVNSLKRPNRSVTHIVSVNEAIIEYLE